jgi:hypothetical protein
MDIDDRKRAEERMRNETLALREDIDHASMFEEIVGASPALQRVSATRVCNEHNRSPPTARKCGKRHPTQ